MLVDDWEELFPERILIRGYDYWLDGRVVRLKPEGDDWRATVQGTRDYHVVVPEDVADSTCDCPYFPEGGFCKHIAAACYEIDDHEHAAQGIAIETFFGPQSPEPLVEDLVRGLDHDEQLAFLLEIVRTDGRWAKRAVRMFGRLDAKLLKYEFTSGVLGIASEHMCRGVIDHRHVYDFEDKVYAYIADFLNPLMRRGAWSHVLQLTFALERTLAHIPIDDTGGFLEGMLRMIDDYWRKLLQVGDAAIDEALFARLSDLAGLDGAGDEDDVSWHLREHARRILEECFATRERFAERVEELTADALAADGTEDEAARFATNFERTQWLLLQLRAMMARNAPLAELEAVVEGHAPSADATRLLVEYARSLGDDEAAIRILSASIAHPAGRRHPTEFVLELIKLLNKAGRFEESGDLYLDLIAHGSITNQDQLRSWVRKARKRFVDTWPEAKRRLIASLDGSPERLASFLAVEGDYREMMDVLEKHGTLEDLNDHQGELATRYPEEFLSRYEQLVRKEVFGPATGRSAYRGYVRILERMRSLPGGQAAVADIVRDLCETYPRRTALKEELRHLR